MTTRKAETYPPETYVLDLAELRQIVFEMQQESEQSEVDGQHVIARADTSRRSERL
jgi:hypothetical protein